MNSSTSRPHSAHRTAAWSSTRAHANAAWKEDTPASWALTSVANFDTAQSKIGTRDTHTVTRRERISFLLTHYSDVLAGVRDRGLGGEHLPLMCRAWNGPSYQELERLLPILGRSARPCYRAVVGMYIYPRFVRRAVCPNCGIVKPPALVGELHKHPHRKSTAFVARMVRVPLFPVAQGDVDGALVWFDEHWQGEPYVPDELLPLVTAA